MLKLLKQTWTDFLEDKCPRIAAALAYSTAFSLAPMLVMIISVCQIVFEPEDIRGRVESEITNMVGSEGAAQIKTMLDTSAQEESKGWFATLAGIAVMIVGATALFAQLQAAMNDVWEVQPDPNKSTLKYFFKKRLLSLGMVLSVAFLVLVSVAASSALHAFDGLIDRYLPGQAGSTLLMFSNQLLTYTFLVGLFAAMFKILPDAEVTWTDVRVGAAVTALLFMVGKYGIGWYLGGQSMASTYGAAGSMVAMLLWVYYSTMILLIGAEFTQAWAKIYGQGIQPSRGALRVIKKTELQSTPATPMKNANQNG